MADELIITYDNRSPEATNLIVARKDNHDFTMLNKIQGDAAIGIYHYLTGGADLINEKDIPKRVVSYSDDENDHAYCPRCNECIGTNEMVCEDFYCRGWSPMYCQECGQAMVW